MDQTGIKIKYNTQGMPAFAFIDLRKYGEELKDFLHSKGFTIEKPLYDPEFVEKIKSQEDKPGIKIKASEIWD